VAARFAWILTNARPLAGDSRQVPADALSRSSLDACHLEVEQSASRSARHCLSVCLAISLSVPYSVLLHHHQSIHSITMSASTSSLQPPVNIQNTVTQNMSRDHDFPHSMSHPPGKPKAETSQGGEYQGPKTKNKAQHSDPMTSYAPKDDKIARCNNARARARAADYRLLPVYSPSNPDHVVPADVTWAHTHSTHVLRCIEWDSSGRLVLCRCQPSYNSPHDIGTTLCKLHWTLCSRGPSHHEPSYVTPSPIAHLCSKCLFSPAKASP